MAQREVSDREKEKDTRRQAEARQRTSNLYSKMGREARRNLGEHTRSVARSTPPAESHDDRTTAENEELKRVLGVSD